MNKVNTRDISEETSTSPKGKFTWFSKSISEVLARQSGNSEERQPFEVEILRVPAGKIPYPYHSHSAQWEFYHVISGRGGVRHAEGITPIEAGDAFLFKPGEPHQFINTSDDDLVIYVIADNPVGESVYYPDSNKWAVHSPEYRLLRSEQLDYFDGEE